MMGCEPSCVPSAYFTFFFTILSYYMPFVLYCCKLDHGLYLNRGGIWLFTKSSRLVWNVCLFSHELESLNLTKQITVLSLQQLYLFSVESIKIQKGKLKRNLLDEKDGHTLKWWFIVVEWELNDLVHESHLTAHYFSVIYRMFLFVVQ